jgi:hypothetical protein
LRTEVHSANAIEGRIAADVDGEFGLDPTDAAAC